MKTLLLISFAVFIFPDVVFSAPPPNPNSPMSVGDYEQLISLFLGGLTGIAFVIAASMRW